MSDCEGLSGRLGLRRERMVEWCVCVWGGEALEAVMVQGQRHLNYWRGWDREEKTSRRRRRKKKKKKEEERPRAETEGCGKQTVVGLLYK